MGDADSSELIARIRATDDSVMPPEDNSVGAVRLTDEEIELVAQWINAGAAPPTEESLPTIQWRAISEEVRPIYSLQMSADGHYLSFAKGNIAYIVPQPLAEGPWEPLPLLDPDLQLADGSPLAATDKDLVHSLAFSHDGQKLAVGGFRTVKLWERQVQALPSTNATLAELTVIPTSGAGPGPVAQNREQALVMLDDQSRQIKLTLGQPQARVIAAAWANDNASLYVIDDTNRVSRWTPDASDVNAAWTAEELALSEPLSEAMGLTVNAENQLLVILGTGRVVRLIADSETWRSDVAFEMERALKFATISTDGQLLLAIGQDASATVWRLADGGLVQTLGEDYLRWQQRQKSQRQIARQEGWIKRLTEMVPGLEEAVKKEEEARAKVAENHQKTVEAQQAKEQEIATAQQTVSETEQAIAALEQQLAEKREQLVVQQKAVTDLQAPLVTAQQNVAKAVQALTSADAGLQLARDKIPAHQARIESQQSELTQNQQTLEQFLAQPSPEVVTAAFDAKAQQVLLVNATGQGLLYRVDSGRPLAVLPPPADVTVGTLSQISTATDGLTTISTETATWQWDLSLPWKLTKTWGGEQDDLFSFRVTALAFSPDDQHLAVGSGPPSRYGDLKVISLETGEVERDYGQVHSDTILALEYSPDGRWLASAGADKLCRLHDPQTGATVKILEGHTHFVQGLSWQDHAQALATASADQTVKTWDIETGERRQSIGGFGKEISAISYVGDSDQVLTVALDGHTRLHRGDNAQLVRTFAHNPQPLYALTLSVDGKHVIVGDHDGKIRVYQVEDGKQLRQWPE